MVIDRRWLALVGVSPLLLCAGCGGGQSATASKTVSTAQQAVASAVQGTMQQVVRPVESSAELTFSTAKDPLKIVGGEAKISVIQGRPIVVQTTIDASDKKEPFPAFYLRVQQRAENVSAMQGKTLAGQIYYQAKKSEPPLTSGTEKLAPLMFEIAADSHVIVSFQEVPLLDAEGKEAMKVSGKVWALVRPPETPPASVAKPEQPEA
jgi:hypothetical protein